MGEDHTSPRMTRKKLYPELNEPEAMRVEDEHCDSEHSRLKTSPGAQRRAVARKSKKSDDDSEIDVGRGRDVPPVNREQPPHQASVAPVGNLQVPRWKVWSRSIFQITVIVLLVAIIVTTALWFWRSYFNSNDSDAGDDLPGFLGESKRKVFKERMLQLKTRFPSQRVPTWRSIQTAVLETMSELQPRFPGVVSMIPLGAARDTTGCLAKRVGQLLMELYRDVDMVVLDGEQLMQSHVGTDAIGSHVNDEVRGGLGRGHHVVMFYNFDKIPARSGMLLHGLCDTDNAPFKQAVYILTIGQERNETVGDVDVELTTAWKDDLSEEERLSLETRIANHVVTIVPENKEVLDRVC